MEWLFTISLIWFVWGSPKPTRVFVHKNQGLMVEAFLQASGSTESMHLWCERPFYTTAGSPQLDFLLKGRSNGDFGVLFSIFLREKYSENSKP